MSVLQDRLKLLDAKQGRKRISKELLPVYYGWAKLNKVQKREALMVIFLNDPTGPRIGRDGQDGVTKYMIPVYKRWQTEDEMKDAELSTRTYSAYSIFMDEKTVKGSLEAALDANYNADKNNVTAKERDAIRKALREKYMADHPEYREPAGRQLYLFD